ncbi:hypothetical protein KVH27_27920 [Streptomyces olivaceus]|uniref:hypothetical protein n=1 Tax=Streptomyces olivaceus TaxID=47716 RepID=UPI001CC92D4D|nr:hypothetical protein [Streptomyces olivaceus]MBZ6252179.1 hypothetical protein [Streptomyces olivaceus]
MAYTGGYAIERDDEAPTHPVRLTDQFKRAYATVGGAEVERYTDGRTDEPFWRCTGCGRTGAPGFGWDEKAHEQANAHAGECRAKGRG